MNKTKFLDSWNSIRVKKLTAKDFSLHRNEEGAAKKLSICCYLATSDHEIVARNIIR